VGTLREVGPMAGGRGKPREQVARWSMWWRFGAQPREKEARWEHRGPSRAHARLAGAEWGSLGSRVATAGVQGEVPCRLMKGPVSL